MSRLTTSDLAQRIDELTREVAKLAQKVGDKQAIASALEPVAVPAAVVAKMLSIHRAQVYELHHAGAINGFRPTPKANMKFLVEEIRELARRMSEARENC
jgi:hypothetical protein